MALQVLPAVDVLGESAARLEQGAYDRVVAEAGDPATLVRRFASAGAALVHVVDLDGARSGRLRAGLIGELVAAARPAAVQASGGVRSVGDALALVAAGAERVVVGTAALASEEALGAFAAALGERLVVALDVRDGEVRTAGWTASSGLTVDDALGRCAGAGVARVLCTAISRDGTLGGPDVELIARVVGRGPAVLAAGGVSSEADLEAVERAGCEAAVVGRAFLEGRIPLERLGR
jgi:phosphoribosylformimino-5-aminoimidazole carboxamide ribotide isomerase